MKYAIIKIINGNYFIHSEGITDPTGAKMQFHGLCQTLWNSPDVITACVVIVDENLGLVSGEAGLYKEIISHEPDANI
ncbi:MAG: hypothetical protein J6Y02_22670 [Pseudobutyrivibrio sp.]|nr:hypothetical protein [Pseudobutyrivibrio sp.]